MSGPNTEARPDTTRRSSWSVFGGTAERGPSMRGAAALSRRHEGPRAPARRRKPRQVRCQPRRRPGSRRYRATDQWGTKAERAAAPIHACWPTTVMCDSGTRAAPRLITGWQAARPGVLPDAALRPLSRRGSLPRPAGFLPPVRSSADLGISARKFGCLCGSAIQVRGGSTIGSFDLQE